MNVKDYREECIRAHSVTCKMTVSLVQIQRRRCVCVVVTCSRSPVLRNRESHQGHSPGKPDRSFKLRCVQRTISLVPKESKQRKPLMGDKIANSAAQTCSHFKDLRCGFHPAVKKDGKCCVIKKFYTRDVTMLLRDVIISILVRCSKDIHIILKKNFRGFGKRQTLVVASEWGSVMPDSLNVRKCRNHLKANTESIFDKIFFKTKWGYYCRKSGLWECRCHIWKETKEFHQDVLRRPRNERAMQTTVDRDKLAASTR